MDGLIHISEISWSHVNHPSEVLEIGQTVKVRVLDIDRERQRISLGLKQTQSDPWQQVLDQYSEGDVVEGKVTKVVTFGAFVEIMPGVEGLVHISELAQHHVENPREVVAQGDQVQAKIIEVDPERRRLSLSLKRVEGEGPTPASELGLSDEVFGSGSELAHTTGSEPSPEPVAGIEESAVDAVAEPGPVAGAEESAVDSVAEPEPVAGIEESAVDSVAEPAPEETDEQQS
jgi:small subunit ribosomal protein S1